MNVLRFRRDRRQRDPFAAAPVAAPEAPARAPEQPHPAYESRMDVDATFAGLVAQARAAAEAVAQQEAERERLRPPGTFADPRVHNAPWGRWDHPDSFPAAMHAEALGDEHGRWYGWDTTVLDNPPAHTRPYIPGDLGREKRMSPASATIRADLGGCLIFRDAVHAEFVRRQYDEGPARGAWQDRFAEAWRTRTGPVDGEDRPSFRIAEMMHAHYAGMLAMHVTERAA